ncbi:MAG TPA: thiamine-phosphate kinase [Pyrinomonadaceae bacterium]|nr:thiamine-phosphate kinase [Pyrinomonadaceae bacterium]
MNEFEFIARLREQASARKHSTRIVKGIGDDASTIREAANRDLIVTTDLLVEGVDFHRQATPPRLLGHKALAVSLSDIAAMGARPYWSFLSFGMPRDAWSGSFKDEFISGYFALADQFGVTLAGGDVSETKEGVVVDSIVLGEVESGAAVLRSGARVGDQIFVTGNLGGAAAGLKLIELGARVLMESEPGAIAIGPVVEDGQSKRTDDEAIQALLLRQLRPEPRVGWGIVLGEERLATSMIDLSDGLSSDLHHLCEESNVGAIIDAASLPLNDNVKQLCGRRALDPLALALHGGEDFELLFTVAPENVSRLPKRVDGVAISPIGEITELRDVQLKEKNRLWQLEPGGFEHFAGTGSHSAE